MLIATVPIPPAPDVRPPAAYSSPSSEEDCEGLFGGVSMTLPSIRRARHVAQAYCLNSDPFEGRNSLHGQEQQEGERQASKVDVRVPFI
jgi:hypothetical protein